MKLADRLLRAAGACLFGALAVLGSASAQGQQVTNIATARWSVGGEELTMSSNEVTFAVVPGVARLATYVPMRDGDEDAMLEASYCSAPAQGPATAPAGRASARVSLHATDRLHIGQRLIVRVDAARSNADPGTVETLELHLTTPDGDEETIVARESSPDSGAFFGAVDTTSLPPALRTGDCRLSLKADDVIAISTDGGNGPPLTGAVGVLADPFGLVFSSRDGMPVTGARVTIVNDATGAPADVFAFDGVTPYPSTVLTGQPVTDASGTVHPSGTGEYRFPLLALGRYRLIVEPPDPFSAPSERSPQQLSGLSRPDGLPFALGDGSYALPFAVDSPAPVRIDIPVDSPGGAISIQKSVSRDEAQPGDALFFQLTVRNLGQTPSDPVLLSDLAPSTLRLAKDSARLDGQSATTLIVPASDGHGFTLALPALAAGQTRRITYAMTVVPDAAPGQAINRASARAGDDAPVEASVSVRIRRDELADRMTLIGRVTAGSCEDQAVGIRGARVMLEDGSFAVTDAEGRYHFDGVVPGTHVVRALETTLPQGGRFVDCAQSARTAGSASTRFVTGQGGSLVRADFTAALPVETAAPAEAEPAPTILTDQEAAGAGVDWMALGDGPDEIIFPVTGHNPRSGAIRVVVRHRPGQSAALTVDGRSVDPLAYDGVTVSPDERYAISIWRGVRLNGAMTRLAVALNGGTGASAAVLEREVAFADTPMIAQLVEDRSRLIADGASPPVLAVRFLDRHGRPVHAGISGSFTLEGPYEAASSISAQQSRELTGFGNMGASWVVEGDDGIAYIELAPTMVSGALRARFSFSDGESNRETELEAWIEPGDQPWTLVGLAEGSIGARTVADNMERGGAFDSDLGDEARIAFYAKGRILGSYLLTIAYDSAKQKEDQRLLGAIDPAAYYTVYGDNAERMFDAASREKLYVRLESRAFYALLGDFETGFDQTQLARYQRTATGVKSEARVGQVQAQGFAARISTRHRRDEFQGGGISGPYALGSRDIVANSEVVVVEVRDRLRSELVIERRELVRFIDYDIDLLSGTITFAEPVLSRDAALNPRFVVIDYETDGTGGGEWNAGLRGAWTSDDGRIRVGATALTDKGDADRTDLGAVDVRVRVGAGTELRAEAAVSRSAGESASALSAEIEHHSGKVDVLAYARQLEDGFGLGQQNLAERGRRKLGADARVALTEKWSLIGSAWHDESLTDDSSRDALELRAAWRSATTDAHLGIAHLSDRLADGSESTSTVLEGGATQRLFDNKLELSASSSLALSDTDSVDLPSRHRLSARYAIAREVRAVGTFELAEGDAIKARTFQAGLELTPWRGSKVLTTLGAQSFSEDAHRTFASVAFGQSLRVTDALTLDATLDGSRTLAGGISPFETVNPHHPVSSGGHLGEDGSLGEDFTAATLGAAWQQGRWSARARGEYRDGELANRKGFTFAAIRQLGQGSVVGSGLRWTSADGAEGVSSEIMDATLSLAHRPANSPLSLLSKLEYRSDEVRGAVAGAPGPVGSTALTVDGDARSRRMVGSVSANWAPRTNDGRERGELGLFVGLRHNLDRFEGLELADTTLLTGADVRLALGDRIEIGGRASVRTSLGGGATSFAIGPEIGFVPAENMLLSVGYNLVGFRDPDFGAARSTERGLFAAVKMKFDEGSFDFLGLGRR
jgi:uncharacterized repeat protein (TIGR01451 family)